MSVYTLSINIHSQSKELLEDLMITLETVRSDISKIDSIELLTISGPACICYPQQDERRYPTTTQRNLFLDQWVISENAG